MTEKLPPQKTPYLLFFLLLTLWNNPASGGEVAALTVYPEKYDFGFVGAGSTSPPVVFTISNRRRDKTIIKKISVSISNTSAFSIDTDSGPKPCGNRSLDLAAGENCSVTVRFHPFASGAIKGILEINSGDNINGTAALLTGFAIACGC